MSAPDTVAARSDAERKRVAGLRAALALRGPYVVHELADRSFVVVFRGQSRDVRDLDQLEELARRAGAIA